MHQRLKERLVGAAVLVVIAVIFIPMLLTGPMDSGSITKSNIPDRPTEKFNSKLIPLTDSLNPTTEVEESNPVSEPNRETSIAEEIPDKLQDVNSDNTKPNADTSVIEKKPVQKKVIKDKKVGLSAWVVQLGSFSSKVNADKLNLNLRKSGFPAFVEPLTKKGETSYRVRVGPEILRADADALLKKIKSKMKLDGIVLSYP
jgi:DedD protein